MKNELFDTNSVNRPMIWVCSRNASKYSAGYVSHKALICSSWVGIHLNPNVVF